MTAIFIGIGSNIERRRNVAAALAELQGLLGDLAISPVYETAAMGFEGDPFLNLVVGADCSLPLAALAPALRKIERDHGYIEGAPRFSPRALDLDLLTYGDCCGEFDGVLLPRPDIVDYAYVLWPLADLDGGAVHPALGISYATLRQRFSERQALRRVPFQWQGCDLSAD
jgi:2-amino-4-hydroxy-6-hydroxymethyldihydropteridine diphosphokinase